jgi:hypothetical protein
MTSSQGSQTLPEPDEPLAELIHSRDADVLRTVAASPRLTEDLALSLLSRTDLPAPVTEAIAKNQAVTNHRKVLLALVSHLRTPRHVSLPLVKHLFTFELMQIVLTPGVAADLKIQIEESLIQRLESISAGERISLAKRGPTRVAAALLCDSEDRVREAALQNPHLTEDWVVKALMRDETPAALVLAVSHDRKWSLRRDVQIALLRNEHTPLARAIAISDCLPTPVLSDVLHQSRLNDKIKTYLQSLLQRRLGRGREVNH